MRDRLRPVPYQEAPSPPMNPGLYAACAHAVHVVSAEGQVLSAGGAVIYVLDVLGFARLARVLNSRPIRPLIELGYHLVARNRHLIARLIHCPRPPV